jgi:hypothetical protein
VHAQPSVPRREVSVIGTPGTTCNGRALIDAGLDKLRVSLDASNRESFKAIRGRDYFGRITRNVVRLRDRNQIVCLEERLCSPDSVAAERLPTW